MVVLRRVKIHQLRSVRPGCEFELHDGVNVLLGQNGTGKTTLLRWLANILSVHEDDPFWSGEEYHIELDFELQSTPEQAAGSVHLVFANRWLDEEPIASADRFTSLRSGSRMVPSYELYVTVGTNRYEIQISESHLTLVANDRRLLDRVPHEWGRMDSAWAPITAAAMQYRISSPDEQIDTHCSEQLFRVVVRMLDAYRNTVRFDESLEFFADVVGEHARAQLGIGSGSERGMKKNSRLMAEELFAAFAASNDIQSSNHSLGLGSQAVGGFFAKAVALFGHRDASLELALIEKEPTPSLRRRYGKPRMWFELHDGSIINHDRLSYGQKRMLSFLYYLALNPRFILVDELVNGLHHAWIERCIAEIGDRQGLVTSQNPLLLDYLSFESAEEVRRRFVLCRSERVGDREELIWRNPTPEEAESFFTAYQAGVQHVGEILIDKGLW